MNQSRFRAALLDPGQPAPPGLTGSGGGPAARRFGIYRNNVTASLTEALRQSFPVVRALVGEDFFTAMAIAHLRAHPPASPLLMFYGQDMADFVAGFAPAQHLGYLPDVARLELALRLRGARVSFEELKRHPSGAIFENEAWRVQPARAGQTARFDVMPADVADELAQCRAAPPARNEQFPFLLSSRRLRDIAATGAARRTGEQRRDSGHASPGRAGERELAVAQADPCDGEPGRAQRAAERADVPVHLRAAPGRRSAARDVTSSDPSLSTFSRGELGAGVERSASDRRAAQGDRVFRGSREQMLVHLFGKQRLTARERAILESILKERKS